jgi:CHASE3 domain sensor protein
MPTTGLVILLIIMGLVYWDIQSAVEVTLKQYESELQRQNNSEPALQVIETSKN